MKIARQASQNHHHNTGTSADAEMNRVGARSVFKERKYKMKKVTIPTAFGPDTIWIDGRAYYDVPEKRSTPPDYKPNTTPPESKP